ncbi:MAG: FecR family protein [bacterium]
MIRKYIAASVCLLCIILSTGAMEKDDKKGIVTYTDGTVKKRNIEVDVWKDAPINTDVLSGDKVRTYEKSRAEIDLASLDVIRLAPKTIIDVLRLYEETKEKKAQTKIKLNTGEVWASVHDVEMDTEFDISAPVGAAAITGTVLRLKVDEDSTAQLKVYKGEVKITTVPEKTDIKAKKIQPLKKPHQVEGPTEVAPPKEVSLEEWVYIVKSMQQITFDKKGKILSIGNFSSEDKGEKSSWVKWNFKRDSLRTQRL